jgi:hypothetical protein
MGDIVNKGNKTTVSSALSKYMASTKNLKNLLGSKYKVGYWGEQTLTAIAKVQTAKAVQDQFNFGSGAYNADLKLATEFKKYV